MRCGPCVPSRFDTHRSLGSETTSQVTAVAWNHVGGVVFVLGVIGPASSIPHALGCVRVSSHTPTVFPVITFGHCELKTPFAAPGSRIGRGLSSILQMQLGCNDRHFRRVVQVYI